MNNAIDSLVQIFLRKDTLEHCSVSELEELVEKYPFFSTAQLALTQKLRVSDSDGFTDQLKKTQLHFQPALWLDQLTSPKGILQSEKKAATVNKPVPVAVIAEPAPEIIVEEEKTVPLIALQEEEQAAPSPVEESRLPEPVVPAIEETGTIVEEEAPEEEETETALEIEIPTLKMEPINPATAELSFEPYHTVDYFASQGIKISAEEKSRDKFGQQLKSFTEWLKTLKKNPPAEIVSAATSKTDKQVDQMAEHSLAAGEIETEAMAEVWIKQGNPEKAAAIYQKLSLLNPSKSSYFAGLIEQLKKS